MNWYPNYLNLLQANLLKFSKKCSWMLANYLSFTLLKYSMVLVHLVLKAFDSIFSTVSLITIKIARIKRSLYALGHCKQCTHQFKNTKMHVLIFLKVRIYSVLLMKK